MGSEILINVTHGEIRVALLEGGQVVEFYIERKRGASLVGNIYKGKVVKILPGMQSAFVDIGLEKAAFLYVGDIQTGDEFAPLFEDEENGDSMDFLQKRGRSEMSIDEVLQEGQELLVQVSKDPHRQQRREGDIVSHLPRQVSRTDAGCGPCRHIQEDIE